MLAGDVMEDADLRADLRRRDGPAAQADADLPAQLQRRLARAEQGDAGIVDAASAVEPELDDRPGDEV